jgi:hypothetical protein
LVVSLLVRIVMATPRWAAACSSRRSSPLGMKYPLEMRISLRAERIISR